MKFLTIEKVNCGYAIKDSINEKRVVYLCYTLENAIKKHRENFNVQKKHFTRIYI